MKNIIMFTRHSLLLLAILYVGSAFAQLRTTTHSEFTKIKTQQMGEITGVQLTEKMVSGMEYILEIDLENSIEFKSLFVYGMHPSLIKNSHSVNDFRNTDGINTLGWTKTGQSSSICLRVRPKTDIGTLFFLSITEGSQKTVPVTSVTITDIPKLKIEGPGTLCPGEQITLNSNLDFDAYSWSMDNQMLPGENSPSIEVTQPGRYQLIGYTKKGCEAAAITFIVRKDLICSSITDFDHFSEEEGVHFAAVDDLKVGTIAYFWSFGDGEISVDEEPVHQYKTNGTYEVCLKKSLKTKEGRASDRTCKTITVTDTKYSAASKTDETVEKGLDVFPNPNQGTFELRLNGVSTGELIHLSVYNEAGIEVLHRHATATSYGYTAKLTMPELAAGNYFLQVTTSKDSYYQKLIIQ